MRNSVSTLLDTSKRCEQENINMIPEIYTGATKLSATMGAWEGDILTTGR